jgi:hypothetical protein
LRGSSYAKATEGKQRGWESFDRLRMSGDTLMRFNYVSPHIGAFIGTRERKSPLAPFFKEKNWAGETVG